MLFGHIGSLKKDAQVQVAVQHKVLYLSLHRMCHFGLRVDVSQKQPSSVCFAGASTEPIEGHPCACEGPNVEHVYDWKTIPFSSERDLRFQAYVGMATHLLGCWLDSGAPVPGSRPRPCSAGQGTPDSRVPNSHDSISISCQAQGAHDSRSLRQNTDGPGRPARENPQDSANTTTGPAGHAAGSAPGPAVAEPSRHKRAKRIRFGLEDDLGLEETGLGPEPQHAFPTEAAVQAKVREKARKQAGLSPVKRKFTVEEHFDDCGTDLSGLGPDVEVYAVDIFLDEDSGSEPELDLCHVQGLAVWGLRGSEGQGPDCWATQPSAHFLSGPHELVCILLSGRADLYGDDIVELCGGAARVSSVCVRRCLRSGGNYDLVTQCDLNDPAQQRQVLRYIQVGKPLVVVMAPTCTPFGALARVNYYTNHRSWLRSYHLAAPHGRFCGEVALLQLQAGRFFVNEQPQGSWLYEERPWPAVLAHPDVFGVVVHQCMTGQVGPNGLPAKEGHRV